MNNADHWEATKHIDMTSPAEIERMAREAAGCESQQARHDYISQVTARHSAHVLRLVEKRAKEIYYNRRNEK